MGVEGMQASLRNNKRDRKSLFDKKGKQIDSTYGKFVDHKKMTTYQFQEFQKKIKKENALRQQKIFIYSGVSILGLITLVIYLLFFVKI